MCQLISSRQSIASLLYAPIENGCKLNREYIHENKVGAEAWKITILPEEGYLPRLQCVGAFNKQLFNEQMARAAVDRWNSNGRFLVRFEFLSLKAVSPVESLEWKGTENCWYKLSISFMMSGRNSLLSRRWWTWQLYLPSSEEAMGKGKSALNDLLIHRMGEERRRR